MHIYLQNLIKNDRIVHLTSKRKKKLVIEVTQVIDFFVALKMFLKIKTPMDVLRL
jgi:hypothetical protein